jgi:cbb3-type cytochrome oxidase maturation protein|tara:strand:+ start:416 stop:640 length:225 start_codon:yes stop_codon:yes gene_type:complete
MDAIYLLVPIALILVIVAVTVFFWAVKSDQFEDLEGPAHSILFDDDMPPSKQTNAVKKTEPQPSNDSDKTSKER